MLKDGVFGMDASKTPLADALPGPDAAFRLRLSTVAWLTLFGATILGANLGRRVLTYHETLFAQPAREMLHSGNWIVPTMCGIPSCHKPPVTYWTLAASMGILGGDSEWIVRLPIVLATIGVALLIALVTTRWHGQRAGFWAGVVQLSSFYVLMQGRLAESDMLFCLAITSAMTVFAVAVIDGPAARMQGRWLAWLFYALVGVAFLVKGPLGGALIGGGVLAFNAWRRQWSEFAFLLSPVGWTIALAVALSWPVAAYLQYPAIVDDWYMHNIDRFAGAMGGQKPPFFYWYMVPLMILPWTGFAVDGVVRRRQSSGAVLNQFLVCWFIAGFALLSLSGWKHKHYLIPILPPFSVFAGLSLANFELSPANGRFRRFAIGASIAVLAVGVVGVGAVFHVKPSLAAPLTALIALAVLGVLAAVWLEVTGGRRLMPGVLAATTWCIAIGVHFLIMPAFDSYRDQTLFAREVNQQTANETIQLVGLPENQIVYYLASPMVREDDPDAFVQRVEEATAPLVILGPKHLAESLQAIGTVEVLNQAATIRKIMTEDERLTLMRFHPLATANRRRSNAVR